MDVVYVDFEYRDNGDQVILGCFFSTETGRVSFDFRDPDDLDSFYTWFDSKLDSLWCCFYGPADLGSLLRLGIDIRPLRFVDAMYEARMITLTDRDHLKMKAGLLASLAAFNIKTTTSTAHKDEMRDLILSTDQYTDDEWNSIKEYCWEDVDVLPPLMHAIRLFHESRGDCWSLAEAEHRGEYIKTITATDMNSKGFPIDRDFLFRVFDNQQGIKDYLAAEVNANHNDTLFKLIPERTKRDGTVVPSRYSFSPLVFSQWVGGEINRGMIEEWKLSEKGTYRSTDKEYMKTQTTHYPYLKDIKDANKTWNSLKLTDLRTHITDDNFIHCNTAAFRAVTGRNGMPPSQGYILGAPKWMRSFIRPAPGMAFIGADWSQQEIGLAAFLSRDEKLRAIFNAGDVYWALAQRAGAIPRNLPASEKSNYPEHKLTRALYKNLQLGISYGKQVKAISLDVRGTVVDEHGMPRLTMEEAYDKAQEMFDWHKEEFRVYWDWSSETIENAYRDGFYRTYDWIYYVDDTTRTTQLLNLPMQSMGASMMRLASIEAHRHHLDLVCSQHDALYISCPLDEAPEQSVLLEQSMDYACKELLGDWLHVKAKPHVYTWDDPYNDEDGDEMRLKILGLLGKMGV